MFVGSATGVDSAVIPDHQSNDIAIAFAYKSGGVGIPPLPAGWTEIYSLSLSSNHFMCGYKILPGGSGIGTGTFTLANAVAVHVYRGQKETAFIGAMNADSDTVAPVIYSGVTMQDTGGHSWLVAFGAHRSQNTAIETPPSGTVLRSNKITTSYCEIAGFDSNGGITSWAGDSISVGGTSNGWKTFEFELKMSTASVADVTEAANLTDAPRVLELYLVGNDEVATSLAEGSAEVITSSACVGAAVASAAPSAGADKNVEAIAFSWLVGIQSGGNVTSAQCGSVAYPESFEDGRVFSPMAFLGFDDGGAIVVVERDGSFISISESAL